MGGSFSMQAQPHFPRVVNQRFVARNRSTTILLDDQFFLPTDSEDAPPAEIGDADLDTVVFKVQRPSPSQKKLMLLDRNGIPIAALESFTVESQLAIYEATNPLSFVAKRTRNAPAPLLARIETNFRPMQQRLVVDLPDGKGGSIRIQCTRRWEDKDALLHIDYSAVKGNAVDVEYIAYVQAVKLTAEEKKKRKAQGLKGKPYKVTIAPGVDMAFVVLVCAALDLESAKKDDVFYPTEEDIAHLAKRPLHYVLEEQENRRTIGR